MTEGNTIRAHSNTHTHKQRIRSVKFTQGPPSIEERSFVVAVPRVWAEGREWGYVNGITDSCQIK